MVPTEPGSHHTQSFRSEIWMSTLILWHFPHILCGALLTRWAHCPQNSGHKPSNSAMDLMSISVPADAPASRCSRHLYIVEIPTLPQGSGQSIERPVAFRWACGRPMRKAQMPQEKEILALNAFEQKNASAMSTDLREAVARRLRSFGSASVLFYQEPLRMERAEGVWMYDADGRRYLDLYNNVPSVGHSHPRVVEAICKHVSLLNTHTRYLNDVVDLYAERLLATFPDAIDHLVLTCTGSEA